MALTIILINADATRQAPLTTQAQADELVPLMNKAMSGSFKKGQMNAEALKVLTEKNLLPDFDGPGSEPHPSIKRRK